MTNDDKNREREEAKRKLKGGEMEEERLKKRRGENRL